MRLGEQEDCRIVYSYNVSRTNIYTLNVGLNKDGIIAYAWAVPNTLVIIGLFSSGSNAWNDVVLWTAESKHFLQLFSNETGVSSPVALGRLILEIWFGVVAEGNLVGTFRSQGTSKRTYYRRYRRSRGLQNTQMVDELCTVHPNTWHVTSPRLYHLLGVAFIPTEWLREM